MKLNLDRDICFFDVESTGLNVIRDRILQIAIIKHHKNDEQHPAFGVPFCKRLVGHQ